MVAKVKRPAGQKDQKSFFSSRYFTVILTVGSLVLTGLVGGLFEYLGGQLAQNAATSADPFDNPQVDVFTEWRNRPEFIKLRAEYEDELQLVKTYPSSPYSDEMYNNTYGFCSGYGVSNYRKFPIQNNAMLPLHYKDSTLAIL